MTPAQVRAALQKAQREQKRAVDNYNREARRYNSAVKKAVDEYNREVRNYNARARAHNRAVESQRRRLRQEVARLESRPVRTFSAYQTSTRTFMHSYEKAESWAGGTQPSVAHRRILDQLSDEAANSVYLVNAMGGDAESADAYTEDELRAPSLQSELSAFGDDLVDRWTGALYALSPQNPDAARHFCTSAREVMIALLDKSAPDEEVKKQDAGARLTATGAVTRRSKVTYLLRRHGVVEDEITDAVSDDVDNLLSLFRTFNEGTHGHAGRFDIGELSAIRIRVESAIQFVHTMVSPSAA